MKYFGILFLTFSVLMLGCDTQPEISDYEVEEEIKNRLITSAKSKYSIEYDWSEIFYNYSIQYDTLLATEYQLISELHVLDVYRSDNASYLFGYTGYYNKYFELKLTDDLLKKVIGFSNSLRWRPLFAIVKSDSLCKMNFELNLNGDEYGVYTDLNDENRFKVMGRLLKIFDIEEIVKDSKTNRK